MLIFLIITVISSYYVVILKLLVILLFLARFARLSFAQSLASLRPGFAR